MIGTRTRDYGVADRVVAAGREALGAVRVPRFSAGRFAFVTLVTGAVIEAVLLARMWLQITGHEVHEGLAGTIFRASNIFVTPFAALEPSTSIKDTGIVQVSALVAIDFYLVLTLVAVLFIFWGSQVAGLFARHPAAPSEEALRLPARPLLSADEAPLQ